MTLTTDTGTIQARAEVTAALEDDDGPTGVTWQWARSPNGRTDWVNIQGATLAAYTPTLEEDRGNYIRATASYGDGHGLNKTAEKVSARVGDPPPVNSAPVFPSTENGQREVEENSAGGATIGDPVVANDLNAGDSNVNDPLVYSLTGTDADSFTIDAGTGQIRLAQNATLDYEGKRTHRFTVQVTDGRDQNGDDDMDAIDDTIAVTVTVTNVNEAPVVTGDAAPSFQEDSSAAIATYTGGRPGARHAHVVGERQRLLDLQPGPALLPHTAQLRGSDVVPGDCHRHRRRRRQRPVRLTVRDDHGDGRGGRGDDHNRAAPWVGRHDIPGRAG